MKKIDLKVKFPRKRWEEIEAKVNPQKDITINPAIIPYPYVEPLTEDDIKAIRRKRRDKQYYKKNMRKIKAKREENYWRKQLRGAKALNEPFKGCNKHHISPDYIVFIPRKLHRKHPHSLKHYWRMDVINSLVIEWLVSEEKRDVAALMLELLPSELLKPEPEKMIFPNR